MFEPGRLGHDLQIDRALHQLAAELRRLRDRGTDAEGDVRVDGRRFVYVPCSSCGKSVTLAAARKLGARLVCPACASARGEAGDR